MSKKNRIKVSCPKCLQEQTTLVWESLNVTLDPEAKLDLLENRINKLICSECGFESELDVELLYHDMEKKFCVLYFPFESVNKSGLLAKFDRYGGLLGRSHRFNEEEEKPYDYMKDIHVVFNREELVRYVIFRDKLIESYKVMEDFSRRLFEPPGESNQD